MSKLSLKKILILPTNFACKFLIFQRPNSVIFIYWQDVKPLLTFILIKNKLLTFLLVKKNSTGNFS